MRNNHWREVIIAFSLATLGVLFVFVIIGCLYVLNENITDEIGERTPHFHHFLQINPSEKVSTSGILSMSYQLGDDESIFSTEEGYYTLISNIGSKRYYCSASCFCVGERRNTALMGKRLVTLVTAVSSLLAFQKASEYFAGVCNWKDFECDRDEIDAKLEDCVEIDAPEIFDEEEDTDAVKDHRVTQGEEVRRFVCRGSCMTNNAFKNKKLRHRAKLSNCDRLSTEYEVLVPFRNEVLRERSDDKCRDDAKEVFRKKHLRKFCHESSKTETVYRGKKSILTELFDLEESTTLKASESPYFLSTSIRVFQDVDVTIEAGVVIEICENCGIDVGGTLIVNGEVGNEVTFTGEEKMKGFWECIRFKCGNNHLIKNAIFEFGGRTQSMVDVTEGDCEIEFVGTKFLNSTGDGIRALCSRIIVKESEFSDVRVGVSLTEQNRFVGISDSIFSDNNNGVALGNIDSVADFNVTLEIQSSEFFSHEGHAVSFGGWYVNGFGSEVNLLISDSTFRENKFCAVIVDNVKIFDVKQTTFSNNEGCALAIRTQDITQLRKDEVQSSVVGCTFEENGNKEKNANFKANGLVYSVFYPYYPFMPQSFFSLEINSCGYRVDVYSNEFLGNSFNMKYWFDRMSSLIFLKTRLDSHKDHSHGDDDDHVGIVGPSQITFENNEVRKNEYFVDYMIMVSGNVTIVRNKIYENAGSTYAISVAKEESVIQHNNLVNPMFEHEIGLSKGKSTETNHVNLRFNWWGYDDEKLIEKRLHDFRENMFFLQGDFTPILEMTNKESVVKQNCDFCYEPRTVCKVDVDGYQMCECPPGRTPPETCEHWDCSEKNECRPNGECVDQNVCKCNPGFFGDVCDVFMCNDIFSNETELVCSGNGICEYVFSRGGVCKCEGDFYGDDCEKVRSKCNGIDSDDARVCSGRGTCTDSVCDCDEKDLYGGDNCDVPICSGKLATEETVCNGRGICPKGTGICVCTNPDYYGDDCENEDTHCYGIAASNENVCSGRGTCVSEDDCECTDPDSYGGKNCDVLVCNGKLADDLLVCSGNGHCSPEGCHCDSLFYGDDCENTKSECNGIDSDDARVCHGRGTCTNSKCNCTDKGLFGGEDCEFSVCFGKLSTDETICSGHGICEEGTGKCACTDPDYFGDDCKTKIAKCFGIDSSDADNVCSGRGTCVDDDKCECDQPVLYGGDSCDVSICNGVRSDGNVCLGRGECVIEGSKGKCHCFEDWSGDNCEIKGCNGVRFNDYGNVCNGHGFCSGGKCSCHKGYSGKACEHDNSDPEVVYLKGEADDEYHIYYVLFFVVLGVSCCFFVAFVVVLVILIFVGRKLYRVYYPPAESKVVTEKNKGKRRGWRKGKKRGKGKRLRRDDDDDDESVDDASTELLRKDSEDEIKFDSSELDSELEEYSSGSDY